MATYLQTEFNSFHEKVKLHDKEDNKELRDKRDMLAEELRTYFKKKAGDEGTSKITFSLENQGSYSMGTGINPLEDSDYDIDVMVLFNISKDDYTPIEVKKWVFEALDKHNRTVEYKKPCVRVQYFKKGKETFHVDLALYSNQNDNGDWYNTVSPINMDYFINFKEKKAPLRFKFNDGFYSYQKQIRT